jgi:Ca2+-transporting ATPase
MHINDAHCLIIHDVSEKLQAHMEHGLTRQEAQERLEKFGANELSEKPRPGFFSMLLLQFNNFLVIILIIAALLSLFLGEFVDAVAILVIISLNAIVGVVQESKAEAALAALKKMSTPNAQVIRDGKQITVPSRELVAGDVVMIEAGNYIPADMRLIESINLKVEEASLTGESVPVEKKAAVVLDREIPLGDRHNSAFMSTMVTYGRGRGLVTATGMHTQIGLIAEMLQSYEEEETLLQKRLNQLGKMLGIICLSICGIIFIYGLIRDTNIRTIFEHGLMSFLSAEKKSIVELFMTAVSLAIAAVPEGLPAIVTICLALGMQRMIKRNALIRKLPAVETLGCATVICSDKTGTLTQNQMTVVQAWTGGKRLKVTGEGYSPGGQYFMNEQTFDPNKDPNAALLLHAAVLCNDARLQESGGEKGAKSWQIVGDPTEGALIVAAAKAGLWRNATEKVLRRILEIPFDSERKRMTTIHQLQTQDATFSFDCPSLIAFVKGAPDIMLDLCDHIIIDGTAMPISDEKKNEILAVNQDMARQALRVLGVAIRPLDAIPQECNAETIEKNLTFIGLMGMIDPARPEVKEAVKVAHGAGLKTIMVTGDYRDTAEAIAKEIGILTPGGKVLSGAELDKISDEQLATFVDTVDVCCRVSPQHKTKIVDALKARGHVVAMTGDGVNDAPALKRANIGIAMGITGSDVSKETADMVLTDDNFASIVSAVEEGRIIYANIRKFVFFLISCNVGEILIIFLAMIAGWPMPLRPVQLLLLNLVTDGAPALALGMEQGEPDIMKRPPRSTREHVINWEMQIGTAVQAIAMTMGVLFAYYMGMKLYPQNINHAQTMAFTTLCMSELLRAFTARSEHYGIFSIGVFSNRWMVWAVLGSAVLVLIVTYLPFIQPIFNTVSLGLSDWLLMVPCILLASAAAEITKIFIRTKAARTVNTTV